MRPTRKFIPIFISESIAAQGWENFDHFCGVFCPDLYTCVHWENKKKKEVKRGPFRVQLFVRTARALTQ